MQKLQQEMLKADG